MANTQVRVELIYHVRCHYLAVAGYRYIVKTRKQDRDAELIYWKYTEKDYTRHRKFMAHIKERARTSLDRIKL